MGEVRPTSQSFLDEFWEHQALAHVYEDKGYERDDEETSVTN